MAMKRWGTSCSQQSNLAGFQAIQASRIFPHCEFFRDKNYQAKTSINIYTYVYMIIYVYIYICIYQYTYTIIYLFVYSDVSWCLFQWWPVFPWYIRVFWLLNMLKPPVLLCSSTVAFPFFALIHIWLVVFLMWIWPDHAIDWLIL
jgi:hypothetical protein